MFTLGSSLLYESSFFEPNSHINVEEEEEEELISLNNQIHYYIKQKVYFFIT